MISNWRFHMGAPIEKIRPCVTKEDIKAGLVRLGLKKG
jgi:hypothetical protein